MDFIIIRGLPGSGKTTLAKRLRTATTGWVEADHFFETAEGYKFNFSKIGQAHAWCLQQTENCLKDPTLDRVIVSNTFTTKKEMQPYFDLAKKYDIKATVILCQGQYGSIHDVPPETLAKMKNRFQFDIPME